jgi:predicted ribosomally synthesized peptide with nif11-like leader
MSIESAKAFLERVENDEDFRKSVGELGTAEERMEFVKKAGFDFTKE